MSDREYDPRPIDELAKRRGIRVDNQQLALDGVATAHWIAENATALDALYAATTPIPGRDGWRLDAEGHEWFSSTWLGRP